MNRRLFLTSLGTLSVLTVGGVVYMAYENGALQTGEGPAYLPWHNWRDQSVSGVFRIVQAGILAASPHNTQPWLFKVQETSIQLFADPRRHLGAMDPYGREMHIGLGCALENMVLAGRAEGFTCAVTLANRELTRMNPTQPADLVATIQLSPAPKCQDSLYQAIPHRHTNRAAYDTTQPVSAELLTQLQRLVYQQKGSLVLLAEDADKEAFAQGTLRATEAIVADTTMASDSHHWFRQTVGETNRSRDGVTLEGLGLSPLMLRLARMSSAPSVESANQSWLDNTRKIHLATASVYGLLMVKNLYHQAANVEAGRVWQRLHLWATTKGLSVQPMNQLMECIDREKQLGKPPHTATFLANLVKQPGWQATFAFRMGYPTQEALPVVRRNLTDVLI